MDLMFVPVTWNPARCGLTYFYVYDYVYVYSLTRCHDHCKQQTLFRYFNRLPIVASYLQIRWSSLASAVSHGSTVLTRFNPRFSNGIDSYFPPWFNPRFFNGLDSGFPNPIRLNVFDWLQLNLPNSIQLTGFDGIRLRFFCCDLTHI